MLDGFKKFIMRGNVIDLAVGIIIGGAFTPIVTALTKEVLLPLIAAIFGKPDFDQVGSFVLNGTTIQPGAVVTALVNFLIIAAAVYFCIVMPMNKLADRRKAGQVSEAEPPSEEVVLLTEIRDALAGRR